MPALTHGRVVNGFNAYSMNYKKIKFEYREKCSPYSCNNSAHPNSNKSSKKCVKNIYVPNGVTIPIKYQKSNSCTSQICRRVNKYSKSKLSKNPYQRGIGEIMQKNILNRKKSNQCKLQVKVNNKSYDSPISKSKNFEACKCFKLF